MTSLYALTSELSKLETKIQSHAELLFSDDPTEAERARQELEDLLTDEADTKAAMATKADAWCWVIDKTRARAAERKAHAQRLASLARSDADRADRLQDQLIELLLRREPDATGFELPEHKLTSRRTTAVQLDPELDAADLPNAYQRVAVEADKTALKAALTAGAVIAGAELVTRRSWRIG